MSDPAIDPCPFCGSKRVGTWKMPCKTLPNANKFAVVWCPKDGCQAVGPVRKTRTGAINAWNKRVVTPPTANKVIRDALAAGDRF